MRKREKVRERQIERRTGQEREIVVVKEREGW
jgi:hypothetical protein